MLFIGRDSEKKKIIESLNDGKNIILGGKFGIGRTSLIKEIAKILANERKFIFVDFSQTPSKMSDKLMKELGLSTRLNNRGKKMRYKSMRYRITQSKSSKQQLPVIVFDNVAKVTVQKIILLRHLTLERNFQFIPIVENFLPQKDLFELKTQFIPSVTLTLRYLKKDDIENILNAYAEQYHFDWTDNHIHNLSALSDGYPLGLVEMLRKRRNPQKHMKEITEVRPNWRLSVKSSISRDT